MATAKGRGKTVIGLFVDGLDVKLAHLSIHNKKIIIEDLKSARLSSKLHDNKASEEITAHAGDLGDGFNVPVTPIQEETPSTQTEDNNAVLYGLIASYPRSKYSLTYSLSEPAIYYHQLESDFGLSGRKLKDRILSELRSVRAFQPSADAVDAIRTDEGNLLCVIREDGMALLNSLENIKGYIGNRLPLISAIDSADVSLINLVRMNYEQDPEDVSVVVYVGTEFTRLIFMRGSHFYQFAPILGEGYDSPNLQNTVYSRLLLEQDNLAIPHIRRIILAGQSHRIGLGDFLSQQLPDQEIEYLFTPRLDATSMTPEQQEAIPEYAIPIGSAMRALCASDPDLYQVNLLPASVREGQRAFQLAWHGYGLIAALFLATLFFTWQISGKSKELRDLHELLALKESQRAENATLATSIQHLEDQLSRYHTSMALYDSLVPGGDRWSRTLTQLSHGVDDLNSIWLTDVTGGTEGDMNMNGFTVYRTRIPRLATLFDNALLEEVNVQEIRKETVYRYRVKVPTAAPSSR
jgi:Tfp pilus assembly protein PilN